MRVEEIIIKPLLSEKANKMSEGSDSYTFKVAKKANKLEIGKAVSKMYGVNVIDVRTMVVPGKLKVRTTRKGQLRGKKSGYKKAIVVVRNGDKIDLYSDI